MTTTQQDQSQIIAEIDAEYYDKMQRLEMTKCQIIREYAKKLEDEAQMPIDKISKHVCEILKKFANHTYIIDCLPDEYKNRSMSKNRAGSDIRTNTKKPKTDAEKYRFYKETIELKNKTIKQQAEEIGGLKKQLAQANKRIVELETKLNKPKSRPKARSKQGTMQQKQDLINKAFAARQEGKI